MKAIDAMFPTLELFLPIAEAYGVRSAKAREMYYTIRRAQESMEQLERESKCTHDWQFGVYRKDVQEPMVTSMRVRRCRQCYRIEAAPTVAGYNWNRIEILKKRCFVG